MVSLGQYIINCWSTYFRCKRPKVSCISLSNEPYPPSKVVQLLEEGSNPGCFNSILNRLSTKRSSQKDRGCPRCQTRLKSANYYANCSQYWRYGFESPIYHVNDTYPRRASHLNNHLFFSDSSSSCANWGRCGSNFWGEFGVSKVPT